MKTLLAAVLLLSLSGAANATISDEKQKKLNALPAGSFKVAGQGSWFAISGCYRSKKSARRRQKVIGGQVTNTSHWPGLRNGFYCVTKQAHTKSNARTWCAQIEHQGDGNCYVKLGQ